MDDQEHPIVQMWGVGKEIWADVDADEYVRSLRENWFGATAIAADTEKPEGY